MEHQKIREMLLPTDLDRQMFFLLWSTISGLKSMLTGVLFLQMNYHYFSKNIIGRKLVDIVINKTNTVYFPCFTFERNDGEDMYEEIVFIFDNGFKLEIGLDCADYMYIAETSEKE